MNPLLSSSTIGFGDLFWALGLITIAISFSRFLKLNLEKDLFIAAIRTTIQLIFIGFVLTWLLNSESWWLNILVLITMTLTAAQAITSRIKKDKSRLYPVAVIVLILSVWPVGISTAYFLMGADGLVKSLAFIPFMGVLLGNALSAISLAFISLEKVKAENLLEVETFKALGATGWEACLRLYRDTLRSSMNPIINGMTIVGVVSLPGVMVGQLLGGVDPLIAARFQILIMFLMAFAALIGSSSAIFLFHYRFMPSWIHHTSAPWLFQLPEKETLFLIGPSGVGKTRLLKSLVGLDSPKIRDKFKAKKPEIPLVKSDDRNVHYLPQKSCFPLASVEDNLKYSLHFKKHRDKEYNSELVLAVLSHFHLSPDLLRRDAKTLSGGEGQVLHLIRTLLLQPEVLLLDEPTANLDMVRAQQMEAFLKNWQSEAKRSLVIISHDQDQIQRWGARSIEIK